MGQKEIQICFTACILQVSMVNWSHILSVGKTFIKDGSYKMYPQGLWSLWGTASSLWWRSSVTPSSFQMPLTMTHPCLSYAAASKLLSELENKTNVVKLASKIRINRFLRIYGIFFFLQVYEQGCSSKDNFSKFQILGSVQMDVFLEPETYYNYLNHSGMENYTLTYLEKKTY